ncbi:MAG: 3-dehydroquinate synthase [Bacteroidales bacterium]|nr:3-dehydroquinate synthase [Bacteroidales bacterium]
MTQSSTDFFQILLEKFHSRFFVLLDENVYKHHEKQLENIDDRFYIYRFHSAESSKTLSEVSMIMSRLIDQGFSKDDLIVNVGGGIVCDVGGFVASTYKRGIRFINVPTTLLAMIDAAHGGKNGVNHDHIKNCIGTIQLPEQVIIESDFLDTLPESELLNGFGELIKYALIADRTMWTEIRQLFKLTRENISPAWIFRCIEIKNELVTKDLHDKNERRILNFGHTVGHALESFCSIQNRPLSHGHAVALGICYESHISHLHNLIGKEEIDEIKNTIFRFFPPLEISPNSFPEIYALMKQDKKNSGNKLNMTLLRNIGEAIPNQIIPPPAPSCYKNF